MKDIELEFDRLLDPILQDKSIWSSGNKFTMAMTELCRNTFLEGFNEDDIRKLITELYRRRDLKMDYHFKSKGFDYSI